MTIKTFTFNPFMENTYVAYDETKECVIIDPGCVTETEQKTLQQFISDNKLTVRHLINTHLHLDHSFGNLFVEKAYGILAKAHNADAFLLQQISAQAEAFGMHYDERPELRSFLTEKDTVKFGNVTLTVIHVPGHSPGSLCFYDAASATLFAGDVLFQGSIGRTDLPKGNYEQLIDGIGKKLFVLPDDTTVYCGHGPTTTIGYEKVYNPYL
ncbi:MAG: fold hydrolase [Bacteroidetes bacterium]|nr:fold hydrolase [Bacteroidota bacterium]